MMPETDPITALYGRVYVLKNVVNGKVYVGQTTKTTSQRWQTHLKHTKRRTSLQKITLAIIEFGPDAFTISEVCQSCCAEDLDNREREAIIFYDSINNGYNVESGGRRKFKVAESSKNKLREAWTEERKRQFRESQAGTTFSDERRANISKAKKGKPAKNKGVKYPADVRVHMGAPKGLVPWNKGMSCPITELQREHMRAAHRGKPSGMKGKIPWNKGKEFKFKGVPRHLWGKTVQP